MRVLEDGKSVVRDVPTGKLYFKKSLDVYNEHVYAFLKDHRNRNVAGIQAYWKEGDRLVVIEELIQGKNLEQVLFDAEKEGGLSFEERIRILTELCDGLSFLHSADPPIIHRDLKASNIMLTEDGVVKIIDYDAAKLFVEGQKRDTQLIGTQGTAAPEQYGFAASDARTDIYALGKLIERMLPDNADAVRISAKATKMDPARRYATAAQIRAAIRKIREHPSAIDRIFEKIPGYDPAVFMHRIMARFGIALVLMCIMLLAVVLYKQFVIEPTERQEAIDNAVLTMSNVDAKPDDVAEASEQLLRKCPYDKMDTDSKAQFREMAKLAVRKYTSVNT
jgi:serine/threonine protein kinase